MSIRFADCVLDSETRELLRDGRAVRVSPKAFQLLALLLGERPRALSKEAIHAALWPKTFVADTTLTTLVKELRATLGDDASSPRYIRTLPGFGYAFSGDAHEVRRPKDGFLCRLIGRESQAGLSEGENIVGRGPDSVLWVDDETVSRAHARIRVEGAKATIEDLGSHNGTFIGRRRVRAATALRDGDEVRLGAIKVTFRRAVSPSSTKSAKPPRRTT
jgi:DNA-binding winged helix-turn-helix (wHTH) protein